MAGSWSSTRGKTCFTPFPLTLLRNNFRQVASSPLWLSRFLGIRVVNSLPVMTTPVFRSISSVCRGISNQWSWPPSAYHSRVSLKGTCEPMGNVTTFPYFLLACLKRTWSSWITQPALSLLSAAQISSTSAKDPVFVEVEYHHCVKLKIIGLKIFQDGLGLEVNLPKADRLSLSSQKNAERVRLCDQISSLRRVGPTGPAGAFIRTFYSPVCPCFEI